MYHKFILYFHPKNPIFLYNFFKSVTLLVLWWTATLSFIDAGCIFLKNWCSQNIVQEWKWNYRESAILHFSTWSRVLFIQCFYLRRTKCDFSANFWMIFEWMYGFNIAKFHYLDWHAQTIESNYGNHLKKLNVLFHS